MSTEKRSYADYPHRVLIMLCGTSPAVITETLYALITKPEAQRFVPTRLRIITTTEGWREIESQLLSAGRNSPVDPSGRRISWLNRLNLDLALDPPMRISPETDVRIPEVENKEGKLHKISDAHSEAELDAMGDVIAAELAEATQDDDSVVVFSLSGGRKSMGHLAGQAMTALGRDRDKLVHVVVEPSWLELPEVQFFYPFKGQRLHHPDKSRPGFKPLRPDIPLEVSDKNPAEVKLAYVPRIVLSTSLAKLAHQTPKINFRGIIRNLNVDDRPLLLEIDKKKVGSAYLDGRLLQYHDESGARLLQRREHLFLLVLGAMKIVPVIVNARAAIEYLQALDMLLTASGSSTWERVARWQACKDFFNAREFNGKADGGRFREPDRINEDILRNYFHCDEVLTASNELWGKLVKTSSVLDNAIRHALPVVANAPDFDLRTGDSDYRQLHPRIVVEWEE